MREKRTWNHWQMPYETYRKTWGIYSSVITLLFHPINSMKEKIPCYNSNSPGVYFLNKTDVEDLIDEGRRKHFDIITDIHGMVIPKKMTKDETLEEIESATGFAILLDPQAHMAHHLVSINWNSWKVWYNIWKITVTDLSIITPHHEPEQEEREPQGGVE